MKLSTPSKYLAIAAVAVLVVATIAIAHDSRGYGGYGGHMMGYGGGYGHMMGYGGYGPMMGYGGRHMMDWNDYGRITDEQRTQLDGLQERFYDETHALRDKIEETQLALRSELTKESPDAGKAASLQKELSRLESDFDQKVLAYRLAVGKVVPEAQGGPGYGYGYGCR